MSVQAVVSTWAFSVLWPAMTPGMALKRSWANETTSGEEAETRTISFGPPTSRQRTTTWSVLANAHFFDAFVDAPEAPAIPNMQGTQEEEVELVVVEASEDE